VALGAIGDIGDGGDVRDVRDLRVHGNVRGHGWTGVDAFRGRGFGGAHCAIGDGPSLHWLSFAMRPVYRSTANRP
jgi:hypothetical protein